MDRNILIVDSDIGFTIKLKRALEEGAFTVRTVTRFSAVVDALSDATYDLLIVDTDLEFDTLEKIIGVVRSTAPTLPVIITSRYYEDESQKDAHQAQAFIRKPYLARQIIPVLHQVIADGYSPYTAHTRVHVAQLVEDEERRTLIDPMIEASRTTPIIHEPPPSSDDSTISEVIQNALDPSTSQAIYATVDTPMPSDAPPPPAHLPESETDPAIDQSPLDDLDYEDMTAATLSKTLGTDSLDALLGEIRNYAKGNLNTTSSLFAAFDEPEDRVYPPPYDEETRGNVTIPQPQRIPDGEWIAQFTEEIIQEASGDIVVNDEGMVTNTQDVPIVQASVEDITREMIALEDDAEDETPEAEDALSPLPAPILAHYAVQLTQFATQASRGALISRGMEEIAHGGDLDPDVWTAVLELIAGDYEAKTRVLYRRLSIGDVLIYSIHSLDELTLTLIFDAETQLKEIRKRANALVDSLKSLPDVSPIMDATPEPVEDPDPLPILDSSVEAIEPPATLPESSIEPFDERREGTHQVTPQDDTPAEQVEQEAPAPPQPKERTPDTYLDYVCIWLVEHTQNAIHTDAAKQLISQWIQDIATEQDWDVDRIHIEGMQVRVELQVPKAALPHEIAETLMQGTAERAYAADPAGQGGMIWSNGYLIRTPADSLTVAEVKSFITFYHTQPIQ